MEKLKKAYYYIFYTIFNFDISLSTYEFNKWKTLAIVSILQGVILIEIDLWTEIIFGKSYFLNQPTLLFSCICLTIVVLNYFALIYKNKWESYNTEFEGYTNKKSKALKGYVFLFILLVITLLVLSFYFFGQFSLHDK